MGKMGGLSSTDILNDLVNTASTALHGVIAGVNTTSWVTNSITGLTEYVESVTADPIGYAFTAANTVISNTGLTSPTISGVSGLTSANLRAFYSYLVDDASADKFMVTSDTDVPTYYASSPAAASTGRTEITMIKDRGIIPPGTTITVVPYGGDLTGIQGWDGYGSESHKFLSLGNNKWIPVTYMGERVIGNAVSDSASTASVKSASTATPTAPAARAAAAEISHVDSKWSTYDLGANYDDINQAPSEETFVSSRDQYTDSMINFALPGYKAAKMSVEITISGTRAIKTFEFMIGPQQMNETIARSISPIKTGGGNFILRQGNEFSRLAISGYFVDKGDLDERRLFLEEYYSAYMSDKSTAYRQYFNNSKLTLELEGFNYTCELLSLDINKTTRQQYLFNYGMQLLVLDRVPSSNILKPSSKKATVSGGTKPYEDLPATVNVVNTVKTNYNDPSYYESAFYTAVKNREAAERATNGADYSMVTSKFFKLQGGDNTIVSVKDIDGNWIDAPYLSSINWG